MGGARAGSTFIKDGYHYQDGHAVPDNIELLLKYKADPNIQDFGGATPLAHAVGKNSIEAVAMLLRAKADANHKDKEGRTPLDYAGRSPHLWELLKEAGATNSPSYDPDKVGSGSPLRQIPTRRIGNSEP